MSKVEGVLEDLKLIVLEPVNVQEIFDHIMQMKCTSVDNGQALDKFGDLGNVEGPGLHVVKDQLKDWDDRVERGS
jgi:hypothetical protein